MLSLSCQRDEKGNFTFGDSSPKVPDRAVYFCKKCYYKYNPLFGDPVDNIPEGTPFNKLPRGWKCPNCGAAKSEFEISN